MAWSAFDDIVAAVRRTLVFGDDFTRTNTVAEDTITLGSGFSASSDQFLANDSGTVSWVSCGSNMVLVCDYAGTMTAVSGGQGECLGFSTCTLSGTVGRLDFHRAWDGANNSSLRAANQAGDAWINLAHVATDNSARFGDSTNGYSYVIAGTTVRLRIVGSDRAYLTDTAWVFNFGTSDTTVEDGFLGLNGATGGTGIDVGGLPLHNFHDTISPSTAETITSGAGYADLEVNASATSILLSALGFSAAANGSVEPTNEVGFRVRWRVDSTGETQYVDDLVFIIGVRRDGGGDYYVQATQANTLNATDEGAANSTVTLDVAGGSGAEYRLQVAADSGGAHTLALQLKRDSADDLRVMVEVWHATERNFY